ncbi:RidA family protein [Mesorhizobium sp. M2A.F.Ca.ET.067.02.1.1]|uniref:RidA family protein n=1 Tax=Mesorhizobium sp. M2A.F.Ca.ET.067.02.1.1 TaxID=2496749 RepID=UPI000FD267C8|nr:RidA family protein [Mesorhizobium sp. M2A.F.Ca.ET.067.02.1.1]RUW79839.1 RidA family protein [Mesorhizobium sp. M2A.F.Ca.ET.067.02.1.1]TIU58945.1 MAG: RidA family protein [Mesorhizobium sp.]
MTGAFTYNGYEIPPYQPPAYGYTSVLVHDRQAWVSGNVPKTGDEDLHPGKVGSDVTLEQAKEAADLAMRNTLASLAHAVGGLDNVVQILKITVFVASAPGFNLQPRVADAATLLLRGVLGERGNHARSAVGVAELPRNSSVEIELVAAVR